MLRTRRGSRCDVSEFAKIRQQINPSVRVYPAHSFGIEPGQTLQMLLERNIYFNIFDEEQFIAFRMRRNQPDAKSFV